MRNTLLHVNNVCRLGGTMLFTRDVIGTFPEFHHEVLYLHSGEDYSLIKQLQAAGTSVSYAPKLTEAIIQDIDPLAIILNNTAGQNLEGDHPYSYLTNRRCIAIHHNPTWPLLEVDLDIFVSEEVKQQYGNCSDRIKRSKIIPPCIDCLPYLSIKRDYRNCRIGKISSDNPDKFPQSLINIFNRLRRDNVNFSIVGGKKYYDTIDWIDMPKFGIDPKEFYSNIDILCYHNSGKITESWGRVITEAMASGLPIVADNRGGITEQIDNGVNGFLCDSEDGFVSCLELLINDPNLRRRMGESSRKKAMSFDIKRFRLGTIGYFLEAALDPCIIVS